MVQAYACLNSQMGVFPSRQTFHRVFEVSTTLRISGNCLAKPSSRNLRRVCWAKARMEQASIHAQSHEMFRLSRRETVLLSAATFAIVGADNIDSAYAAPGESSRREGSEQITGLTLLAEDPDAAAAFYEKAFGMVRVPPKSSNETTVAFGDPKDGTFATLTFLPGTAVASGAGEESLKWIGIAVPNPPAARAAIVAAGGKPAGDGLCSGDHLEGCVVKSPDGIRIKLLKDSSLKKGSDRLCRIALNVADEKAAEQFYAGTMQLSRMKKQQGIVDRLAEDKQPPTGRVLLGSKSGGLAVELFPVFAVRRGQASLVSLKFSSSLIESKCDLMDPNGNSICITKI